MAVQNVFFGIEEKKVLKNTSKNFFETLITFDIVHQTISYKYGIDASDADLQDEYGFYGGQSYNFSQKSTF